jgi:hypothetical protein
MIRVLLDEDVDVRLRLQLGSDVHVETVAYRGWKGKKNGDLLKLAQNDFDVLISADRNLPFQQSIAKFKLGLIVLCPRSKMLQHLIELVPQTVEASRTVTPGQVLIVEPVDVGTG